MMALPRIVNCQNLSLSHPMCWRNFIKHATIKSSICKENNNFNETMTKGFHISKIRKYPEAPTLCLPMNVSEIFANETGRFTPERIRDIYSSSDIKQFSKASNAMNLDLHVASYDCFGTVSLNSSMQTNVPKPFNSRGKSNYLNMPGGQWARDGKYIAEDMQKFHYKCQLSKQYKKNGLFRTPFVLCSQSKNYCTQTNTTNASETKSPKTKNLGVKLTTKEKLQILVKDYGKTIIVFHIGLSLMSLGGFYLAVSSGIDMNEIASKMTGNNDALNKIVSGTSTFAIAYAIHKIFAPVRIMTTLTFAPIVVIFLRRKGILKHPEIIKRLKQELNKELNNKPKSAA